MKQFLLDFWHDRSFIGMLFKISLPILIQNLISSSLNMVDTIMIGKLGDNEIAAVGIANQYFFLFTVILVGICSGICIYIAQYWGKRDSQSIKKYLGVALFFSIIVGITFAIGAFLAPRFIISIFNTDPVVIDLGAQYLRVIAISYIFTAVTFSYGMSCRSVENAFLPMIASSCALLVNTVLNYLLIFGHFGFPALGVSGAALATVIARVIETSILLGYIYYSKNTLAAHPKELDWSAKFLFKDIRTISPVLLNEFCWGLGAVVYSVAYGRISTQAIASVQISQTVQNIFLVIGFGIAGAAAVMIGTKIGEGREDLANLYGRRFTFLGFALGIILSIALFLLSPSIIGFFNVSVEVAADAMIILKVYALTITIRLINMILILGVLRGGGDVSYSFVTEAVSMWCIGVPLAFLGAFIWKLPVYLVVSLIIVEEIVKFAVGVRRMVSNKWIHNLIKTTPQQQIVNNE